MRKIVLLYGGIAGAVIIGTAIGTLATTGLHSEWLGYLVMVIGLSAMFFGIKSYRDNYLGGVIRFGMALKVGLLITLVASLVYVVSWELYFNLKAPDFMEKFAAAVIEKMKQQGADSLKVAAAAAEMNKMKEWYKNPLIRYAMTLMEIFPVGAIISLISAAILKRRVV